MTFKKCKVCGEQVIIWDLDGEDKCKDSCFESYNKIIGIKLHAPEATEAQQRSVLTAALDLCKSFGPAQEAKERLRHMKFVVSREGHLRLEDDLPSTRRLRVVKVPELHAKSLGDRMQYPGPDFPPVPDFAPLKKGIEQAKKVTGELIGALVDMQLEEEHGFTQPEDGSELRYAARSARQSPARHAFWWWLHNCVAHPLIGVMPRRFAFEFHDWTSRKLHGK